VTLILASNFPAGWWEAILIALAGVGFVIAIPVGITALVLGPLWVVGRLRRPRETLNQARGFEVQEKK